MANDRNSRGNCSMFEEPVVRAMAALYAVFVLFFIATALSWLASPRRTPPSSKVVGWPNYGSTLILWTLHAIVVLVLFCLQRCLIVVHPEEFYRSIIPSNILHWLAVTFLLGTVLFPICRGLERLQGSPSESWYVRACVVLFLFTIFVIIHLALFIWHAMSFAKYSRLPGAFPEYIYTHATLTALWLVIILAAIGKMLVTVNRAHIYVPLSLWTWVITLALGLFSYGFLSTFQVFYYDIPPRDLRNYTASESITWQVLPPFTILLSLFAIRQVSQILSRELAALDVAHSSYKPGHASESDPEGSPSGCHGTTR
ncbi:hypothetical protein GTA08_BOTSDO10742 [Neofusicoccum parvum]|nr:hypothetical protein GTA08_BOTSDO10742 [Neofusicoccum parvum]